MHLKKHDFFVLSLLENRDALFYYEGVGHMKINNYEENFGTHFL